MSRVNALILRPLGSVDGCPCSLEDDFIENSAECLHEIVGDGLEFGMPFPDLDPRIIAIVGETSVFTEPRVFEGQSQPWWGTVIFLRRDGSELRSLTAIEKQILMTLLPQLGNIRLRE